MAIDFNDAERQQSGDFTPLPDGTVAPVRATLRGIKKTASGAKGLDFEFVVTAGPFAKRKVWQWAGFEGDGSKGHETMVKITKALVRGMLESAYGVDPTDASPDARAARAIDDWEDLDGIEFLARFKVNDAKPYKDKQTGEMKPGKASNSISAVTPDDPDYEGFSPKKRKAGKPAGAANPPSNGSGKRPAWA
jgi:hypothetical protein